MTKEYINEIMAKAEVIMTESPQPLRKAQSEPKEFPVDSLPTLLKEAALGLHDKIQAPLAICAQSVLATANLAVQGHANIMLPTGQERPLSCFFLTIAESGERKSSCDHETLRVVEEHEESLKDHYDTALESWKNDFAAWETQRQSILKDKKNPDRASKKLALDVLGKKTRYASYTPVDLS